MRTSFAILIALVLAGSTGAQAQQDPAQHRRPVPQRGARQFMEKLGLSEKQKAEIGGLRTEMEKSMVGIDSKIKLARIDMKSLVQAESPDKGAIEGKMKEINDLQYQAKKVRVDHAFAVYALLTPEQQKTARGMLLMRLSGRGMRPMMKHRQGSQWGMLDDAPPMLDGETPE